MIVTSVNLYTLFGVNFNINLLSYPTFSSRPRLFNSNLANSLSSNGLTAPIKFGYDAENDVYGYIKAGADTVTPFGNSASIFPMTLSEYSNSNADNRGSHTHKSITIFTSPTDLELYFDIVFESLYQIEIRYTIYVNEVIVYEKYFASASTLANTTNITLNRGDKIKIHTYGYTSSATGVTVEGATIINSQ